MNLRNQTAIYNILRDFDMVCKQKNPANFSICRILVGFDTLAESGALEPNPQSRFKRMFLVVFSAYSLTTHYTINLIFFS